jgi:phosphotransferase system enzyme I (PtsI)
MMFPMISTLSELQEALQKVEEAKMELRKEQIPFHEKLPVGIMVEIPATAILSDNLAKNVDFFSIGTNDLTQYTLAVDRNNERVAHLYKPYHPAVLRLIKYVIHSAYKHKIEVSMCGEMPTDVSYALLLLGMGLQNFSVNSASIPKIIRALRQVRMRKLIDISCSILQLGYTEDVHRALEEHYNGLLHSESLNSEA